MVWCTGLHAAVDDLPITEVDGKRYHYYEVQPRETIYGLSNKLGMSREEMLRYNPSLVDGLKAGQKLLFPVKDNVKAPSVVTDTPGRTHKVERGETIYGLSNHYGLTVDEFLELNPSARDGLKAGENVRVSRGDLPAKETSMAAASTPQTRRAPVMPSQAFSHEDSSTEDTPATQQDPVASVQVPTIIPTTPARQQPVVQSEPAPVPAEPPVPVSPVEDVVEETTVNTSAAMAVLLPFELGTSQPGKPARRYLEFYKGLLMAVDTLSRPSAPIILRAYDTSNGLQSVLTHPGLQQVQVIVGPGSEEEMDILAPWAAEHGITVLNPFVVKDESYLTNPYVFQSNTPQKNLYENSVRELVRRYQGYVPVFLKREGGPDERDEFVELARNEFMQQGIMPKDITYTEDLELSDLQGLDPMVSYVFIPVTGKQIELNRVLPALVELRNGRTAMGDVTLFGYPEWITFRGETLKNMHRLNTVVFSRFFNDAENPDSRDLENKFYEYYGAEMEKAIPRQGILGFDIGCFAINALRANDGDFSNRTPSLDGLQNAYRVSHAGSRGHYNDAVYFINYRPSGLVERDLLRP